MHSLLISSSAGWVITVALWLLIFGAMYLSWRLAPHRALKVLLPFLIGGYVAYDVGAEHQKQKAKQEYRDSAWAHFKMRCKDDAREQINRTLTGVQGIFLMNPRKALEGNAQSWRGDPYGNTVFSKPRDGKYWVMQANEFLSPIHEWDLSQGRPGKLISRGASFVEMRESDEGNKLLRISTSDQGESLVTKAISERTSAIGVRWADISTPEDRKYWVAGGRLEVVDLQSGEILAWRVGYMIDPSAGFPAAGRVPWQVARAREGYLVTCPSIPQRLAHFPNRIFIDKVLTFSSGELNGK